MSISRNSLHRGYLLAASLCIALGWAATSPAAQTKKETRPAPNREAATRLAKEEVELSQQISAVNNLNGQLQHPALQTAYMESLAKQSRTAVNELQQQHKASAMGYGDLLVANSLAHERKTGFQQIKDEHKLRSWADLAVLYNIKLRLFIDKLQAVQKDVAEADKKLQEQDRRARQAALRAQQEQQRRQREELRRLRQQRHR